MTKIIITILITSLSLSGCSAFVTKTQNVKAACSEPDALLQINGGEVYTGKAEITARRDRVFSYSCLKPGYYPAHKSVSYSISSTGVLDFIGTIIFLIPVVGIFSPGYWDLDDTDTTINMVKYQPN
jgi:hypothetical protein